MENIEIHQKLNNNIEIDPILFKKMSLVFNAIEDGWTIKKIDKSYIFTKKHENRQEVYEEKYLLHFLKTNMRID
uniref:Uncharacterized protein n=1 Tax=viral metagenome TaxID=1070528 RepID=A0A6C0LNH3_9ZZZZ